MIEKTIGEIEAKIRSADSVSDERKRELLQLLGTLKSEVGKLSKTHDEHAQSIAGFANVAERIEPRKHVAFRHPVSYKDANFFVNRGDATSADVLELVRQVRAAVRQAKGVDLEPEVLLYGKDWRDVL